MILVDTSVWIDHFTTRVPALERLIASRQALGHPFVTGELAVGDLRHWAAVVASLRALPSASLASEQQFLDLLVDEKLVASGLGYVDVHLLASCHLGRETQLWSHDKSLAAQALRLGCAWSPP